MMKCSFRKIIVGHVVVVYLTVLLYALFNFKSRCRTTMPDYVNQIFIQTEDSTKKCWIDLNDLEVISVNVFEDVSLTEVSKENSHVKHGGSWSPTDCIPWQKVAIIMPYRDRYFHLKLLLKRLHSMLRKQRIHYRIYLIEQAGTEDFNRGRLMNIGFLEAMKTERFDCFIFHDVDLIPESDKNIYLCDEHARQLSAAIDEQRYHVIYYNYLGGVVAINRENFKMINGYSNIYWGWGNEDDDLSARTLAADMLLTRPPEYIGRYKMVRHSKASRAEHGYDLFLQWRGRMYTDGLNSLEQKIGYDVLSNTEEPLYTNITVDIGDPPKELPLDPNGKSENWLWFMWFYVP